ncbi:hypothetical protein [Brevundimonas sp.]|uniref:hypothetical protein n=1 Tax=Brevundimonas sp. TaxID=1871086 RepID=UPI002FC9EC70
MWNRAKPAHHLPKASWQRELLQPLFISLAPVAYMITQLDLPGEYTFLLVTFLMIGISFLPLLIPQHMVSGSKLHRPSPPHQGVPDTIMISPLQRVSNGNYGSKSRDDYEGRLPLPEIETVPPWVQRLIATLGARIPLPEPPRRLKFVIEALGIIAFMLASVAFMWLLMNDEQSPDTKLWGFLVASTITLAAAYRSTFRRLYDIYTADAAKTGRYAFPALHR